MHPEQPILAILRATGLVSHSYMYDKVGTMEATKNLLKNIFASPAMTWIICLIPLHYALTTGQIARYNARNSKISGRYQKEGGAYMQVYKSQSESTP